MEQFSRGYLTARFDELGPWVAKFQFGEEWYGGKIDFTTLADNYVRLFLDWLPTGNNKILELGPCEGYYSVRLCGDQRVKSVLSLEGNEKNIEKTKFIININGLENFEIHSSNLETDDLNKYGKFSGIFCAGVLYHLQNPWFLLNNMSKVSDYLFLDTHYAEHGVTEVNGFTGTVFEEQIGNPFAGMSKRSFWPEFKSLIKMANQFGWKLAKFVDTPQHFAGPRAVFFFENS